MNIKPLYKYYHKEIDIAYNNLLIKEIIKIMESAMEKEDCTVVFNTAVSRLVKLEKIKIDILNELGKNTN